jgi:hypothetical protein
VRVRRELVEQGAGVREVVLEEGVCFGIGVHGIIVLIV